MSGTGNLINVLVLVKFQLLENIQPQLTKLVQSLTTLYKYLSLYSQVSAVFNPHQRNLFASETTMESHSKSKCSFRAQSQRIYL